jgi:hypothetical protein
MVQVIKELACVVGPIWVTDAPDTVLHTVSELPDVELTVYISVGGLPSYNSTPSPWG